MHKKILYIDDEDENLTGFKAVFRKHYTVYTANDTEKAFAILKETEICVLITDQRMTTENGLDFLKRISPLYPNLICILLTAYSDMQNVIQAINQGGIYRYILKPWDKAEMQLAIDSALDTYYLKKENEQLLNELRLKNIALQKSEETFRNIFNTSVDAIIITDCNGKFLDCNQTALDRTGISKEQLLTMTIFDIVEDNQDIILDRLQHPNLNTYNEVSTSYTNKKLGHKVYLETRSRFIEYNHQQAFLHIARDVTDRLNQEKLILKTIIDTEEKERSRVARELHDGVSPVLAASRLYAQAYTTKKDKNLEPLILNRLIDTIDEAIQSITEISNNLSPHILQNFGLYTAINSFIEKFSETQDIQFQVSINKQERLPDDIETTLYRIVVELINNTLKYAHASKVDINFEIDQHIHLIYSDNGKGFDFENTIKEKKGMGFFNIQSRIKTLNGTITVKSETNKGIYVSITIPLK